MVQGSGHGKFQRQHWIGKCREGVLWDGGRVATRKWVGRSGPREMRLMAMVHTISYPPSWSSRKGQYQLLPVIYSRNRFEFSHCDCLNFPWDKATKIWRFLQNPPAALHLLVAGYCCYENKSLIEEWWNPFPMHIGKLHFIMINLQSVFPSWSGYCWMKVEDI